MTKIHLAPKTTKSLPQAILFSSESPDFKKLSLSKDEAELVAAQRKAKRPLIQLYRNGSYLFLHFPEAKKAKFQDLEAARVAGNTLVGELKSLNIGDILVSSDAKDAAMLLAYAEGMALGNYQFVKYKKEKPTNGLKNIYLEHSALKQTDINELQVVTEANIIARDLVNEPVSYLTAEKLSAEIKGLAKESGFKIEVFNKLKIKTLKMGGLLGVNQGSIDPPTFNILEWNPKNAKNKKPVVLVGKGVTYDTGGLTLKPTPGSMDSMKCDMAGAAAVTGILYAVAKLKLPVHVVGLIPATDNRPGGNALAPGDILTMYDGTTVEVLNSDAEGRLILGDALSYAKKYKPQLVMDFATLTGAAARAIGQYGTVFMGTADEATKKQLTDSGNNTYERLVEFPMWDEYGDMLKSDIADLKNVSAGPVGGAITAGKFLERFTDYPWLHFDIAGPAFLSGSDSYRGKNATGVGIRLIFDFLKKQIAK